MGSMKLATLPMHYGSALLDDVEYDFEYDEALPGVTAPNMLAQQAMKVQSAGSVEWGADRNLRLERLWIESAQGLEDGGFRECDGGRASEVGHGRSPVFVEGITKSPTLAHGSRVGVRWMSWLCSRRRPKRSAAVAPRQGGTSPEVVDSQAETDASLETLPLSRVDAAAVPARSTDHVTAPAPVTVQVPEDTIALAWLNGQPLLLPPGRHSHPSTSFFIQEFVPESSPVIHHGCLHRVSVPEGHVSIAYVDGRPEILHSGVYEWSCSSFSYSPVNNQVLLEKELVLGPFRIVAVDEDEVGIKFRNRKPQVLHHGRHTIDISKGEVFSGFESLCCRKSRIKELLATTADDMRVEAQLSFHWQIMPDDAAAAHLANVADVEAAVTAKFRRAFALVIWCYKGRDIVDMHANDDLSENEMVQICQMSSSFSSDVSKECLDVVLDLFEEGWSVSLWDVQLERLQLYLDTLAPSIDDPPSVSAETESRASEDDRIYRHKKKVRIRVNDAPKVSAAAPKRRV